MATPIPPIKISAELTDPGKGQHLWTMITMFKVSDHAIQQMNKGEDPGPALMDHENLLTVEGPGCYKCEEPYSKYLAHRKCTGSLGAQ